MTSDSEDLEEALRQNLKLRRELAAEVAKAKAASERGGIAYRLGWAFYRVCLILIIVSMFGMIALLGASKGTIPEMVSEVMREPLAYFIWFAIPVIALYGLGRAFRYFLSGE
jgi:hypothetical protein